jgi:hypothetical protein
MLSLAMFPMLMAAMIAPQLDAREPITFFIEDGKGVPGYRDSDRELAKMALDGWSRESAGKLKFTEARDRDAALVVVRWVSPNQGLFGETQRVFVKGRAGANVFVMPQVAQLGEPLATRAVTDGLLRDTIVYLTCVHELGHAVGMNHTRNFADIMYFFGFGGDIVDYFMRYRSKLQSRADIAKYSGLSAGDIEVLRRLY